MLELSYRILTDKDFAIDKSGAIDAKYEEVPGTEIVPASASKSSSKSDSKENLTTSQKVLGAAAGAAAVGITGYGLGKAFGIGKSYKKNKAKLEKAQIANIKANTRAANAVASGNAGGGPGSSGFNAEGPVAPQGMNSNYTRKNFSETPTPTPTPAAEEKKGLSPLAQALIAAAVGTAATAILTPVGEVLYGYSSKLMDSVTPSKIRSVKVPNTVRVPWNGPAYRPQSSPFKTPAFIPHDNRNNNWNNSKPSPEEWLRQNYGDKNGFDIKNDLRNMPNEYRSYAESVANEMTNNLNINGPGTVEDFFRNKGGN